MTVSGTLVAWGLMTTVRGCSWVGGWSSERRRSCSRRSPVAVTVKPRQPREARSSTAQTMLMQEVSPGNRPMTLARRRVSPKVRSMKLECRMRWWCSVGKAQVCGQAGAVGEQDLDCGGVAGPVLGGEGVDAPVDDLHETGAGRGW